MSIYWQVNDIIAIADTYLNSSLLFFNSPNPKILLRTVESLSRLSGIKLKVLEIGTIFLSNVTNPLSYIKVLPLHPITSNPYAGHLAFNNGLGEVIYFDDDETLNKSFKPGAGFFPATLAIQGINHTAMPLTRTTIVRRVGIDPTTKISLIDLASAINLITAVPIGMLLDDLEPGQTGSILVNGVSPPVNMVGTTPGTPIWLSNLPGGFQSTPGEVGIILGSVISVGITGNFHVGSGGIFPVIFQ